MATGATVLKRKKKEGQICDAGNLSRMELRLEFVPLCLVHL